MEYRLDDSHPVYIRMTVTGLVDKPYLIAAMSHLVQHPDYPARHSLWDFTGAAMGISIGDLNEIAGVLRLYKPRQENFADKSALVVPDRLHQSMVDLFISMTRFLPFRYRAFKDIDAAVRFLDPPAEKA